MSISGIVYQQPLGLLEMLKEESKGQEDDFIGISNLLYKQAAQLREFETWAEEGRWEEFSRKRCDWWMFPIDKRSDEHGGMYTVHEQQVKALQRRPVFMKNYRMGVLLLLDSWGWPPDKNKSFNQGFDGNLTRLNRVLQSLDLFGEKKLFESVKEFARRVVKAEELKGEWIHLRTLIWKLST